MIKTNEQYFIIVLLLMSILTVSKAYRGDVYSTQMVVKSLPTLHFMQLPEALQKARQMQDVALPNSQIKSLKLQATLLGDHRQQAIIANGQDDHATLKPDDIVGQNKWHVITIKRRTIVLEQSQGERYELHIS